MLGYSVKIERQCKEDGKTVSERRNSIETERQC